MAMSTSDVPRIGMTEALNRHVERVFDPSRKDLVWQRRKLKWDAP
jgi:hypothetical protein